MIGFGRGFGCQTPDSQSPFTYQGSTMNKEQAMLCELWRKAHREPDGLTIPCTSPAEATRVRFALYNAVKFARDPNKPCDQALRDAVEECSIALSDDKRHLTIRQRGFGKTMEFIKNLVGEVPSEVDLAAQDSQRRLMEKLQAGELEEASGLDGAPAGPRVTPYYTR